MKKIIPTLQNTDITDIVEALKQDGLEPTEKGWKSLDKLNKMKILKIYDNGGKTWDRYTVLTNHGALGLSENPNSSQGFSQWGEAIDGNHLGKRINLVDLPGNVQKHILSRVFDED